MKRLILLAGVTASVLAYAEPKFNALDKTDRLYAEYQRNLCAGAAQERDRFGADASLLLARNTRLTPATAEDFYLSTMLYEKFRDLYETNCK